MLVFSPWGLLPLTCPASAFPSSGSRLIFLGKASPARLRLCGLESWATSGCLRSRRSSLGQREPHSPGESNTLNCVI